MESIKTNSTRLITFFTADLFLLSCALTALFLPYIPIKHDILGLAAHYPVYLQIATVLSCIALYGVFKVCQELV